MRVWLPLSLAVAALALPGSAAIGGSAATSGPYTGVGTGLLDRKQHRETSTFTVDSKDVYRGRFTYSFQIVNGVVRGTGRGSYQQATWRLDGVHRGQRFGCNVPMTAKPFKVAVSGTATAKTMKLRFRLVGAREANGDYDCGANFTGFASDSDRLNQSLQLVQGPGLTVSRTKPKIGTLRKREELGPKTERRINLHKWTITIRAPAATGETGQGAEAAPNRCFGRLATLAGTTGTNGDDVIIGGAGNDTMRGLGGNDYMCGGGGKDTIIGGDGNDFLEGADGKDTIKGGAGDDRLVGNNDKDILEGQDGNDYLQANSGNDVMKGGDGNDILNASGDGDDRLSGGYGDDDLRGHGDDDILDGGPGSNRVDGGAGDDVIDEDMPCNNAATDLLIGGDGDDKINAGCARRGTRVEAGSGDDLVYGHRSLSSNPLAVSDTIYGGPGNDRIFIASSEVDADRIFGGPGDDVVGPAGSGSGGWAEGDDFIDGDEGYDRVKGGDGDDTIAGAGGDDDVEAGKGNDTVSGGSGRDTIDGDSGDDELNGGTDDDKLRGGSGNDILNGGAGIDDCDGEQMSECES